MKLDLNVFPIEALLLTIDYFNATHDVDITVSYDGASAIVTLPYKEIEKDFLQDLNDYIKRLTIADKVRPIKEIIIGRALYGIIEEF